jgi:carotenoid 1,2-hydratase
MTERGRSALGRDARSLSIGPSALDWHGDALTIRLDEVTAPFPSRIRGEVRLYPHAMPGYTLALDPDGRHEWRALAPRATVEVALGTPRLRWRGSGYLDANAGCEPLEAGFRRWDWSRSAGRACATVLYDVERRDGTEASWALRFGDDGTAEAMEPPQRMPLPRTRWRIERRTRADAGTAARVHATLEDGPFYARTQLDSHVYGERTAAIHESISLDRFQQPWVRCLLPFKMPRRG